jgi:hypothetical protein
MLLEINHRTTSYGLTVALLWDDSTNEVFVELETEHDWTRFPVRAEDASEAFAHPFVYQTASTRNPEAVRV